MLRARNRLIPSSADGAAGGVGPLGRGSRRAGPGRGAACYRVWFCSSHRQPLAPALPCRQGALVGDRDLVPHLVCVAFMPILGCGTSLCTGTLDMVH